uniref:procollagen-proline 4-dioxygenase n=1 Tax=Tanacetum cinerariifolium TaxID=118510 RepID=A0A699HFB0_TANCI|nr:probable prolyl 4-hydroxylase 12 isoform X2 [Tanacetum cinerariifolium]
MQDRTLSNKCCLHSKVQDVTSRLTCCPNHLAGVEPAGPYLSTVQWMSSQWIATSSSGTLLDRINNSKTFILFIKVSDTVTFTNISSAYSYAEAWSLGHCWGEANADDGKGKDNNQGPGDEKDEDLKKPYKEVLKYPFTRKCSKDPTEVSKITKRAHKTLPDFKERWTEEMGYIHGFPEVMQISTFMTNSKCPELARRFADRNSQRGHGIPFRGDRPPCLGHGNEHQRTNNYGRRITTNHTSLPGHTTRDVRHKGNKKGRQLRNNNNRGRVINMIREGGDGRKRKSQHSEAKEWINVPITFPPIATDDVSNDPLTIEARVEGYLVHQGLAKSDPDRTSGFLWWATDPYREVGARGRTGMRELRVVSSTTHAMEHIEAKGSCFLAKTRTVLFQGGPERLESIVRLNPSIRKYVRIANEGFGQVYLPDGLLRLPRLRLSKRNECLTVLDYESDNNHVGQGNDDNKSSGNSSAKAMEGATYLDISLEIKVRNGNPFHIHHHVGAEETKENHNYLGNTSMQQQNGESVMATVVFYLSNVTQGGQILFPNLQSPITKPIIGNALLFFNLHPNTSLDPMSLHARCLITEGAFSWTTKTFMVKAINRPKSVALKTGNDDLCTNEYDNCQQWAAFGECERNPIFMVGTADYYGTCRRSCNVC